MIFYENTEGLSWNAQTIKFALLVLQLVVVEITLQFPRIMY